MDKKEMKELIAYVQNKAKSLGDKDGKTPLNPVRLERLVNRLWIQVVRAVNRHDPSIAPLVPFVRKVVGRNAAREAAREFNAQIMNGEHMWGDDSLDSPIADDNGGDGVTVGDLIPEDPELVRRRKLRKSVRDVLAQMPHEERIALASFMYEEMTVSECASILGMSRPTFRKFRSEIAIPHFKQLWEEIS